MQKGQKSVNATSKWADGPLGECVKALKRFIPAAHKAAGDRAVLHPSSFLKEATAAPGTSERHEELWLLQGPAKMGAFSPTSLLSHRKDLPHKHFAAMLAACSSKFFQAIAGL